MPCRMPRLLGQWREPNRLRSTCSRIEPTHSGVLRTCGDGLVQNSIAELARPDLGSALQPDPLASLDGFLNSAYPALSDVDPVTVAVADEMVRYAVADQGEVKAYFDVSLNGAGNWTGEWLDGLRHHASGGGVVMKRVVGALPLVVAALVASSWATPAGAHSVANYYPRKWAAVGQLYFFTTSVPDGEWRTRIRGGVAAWNNQGQPMRFGEAPPRANFDGMVCPPTAGTNGVHRKAIDGQNGILAVATVCSTSQGIYSANITFDQEEDWYTGSGTPAAGTQIGGACLIGPCEVDLWSVASHEWGHATGFAGPFQNGHFDPGDEALCSEGAQKETMCPTMRKGDTNPRTLHTHDRHTCHAAY